MEVAKDHHPSIAEEPTGKSVLTADPGPGWSDGCWPRFGSLEWRLDAVTGTRAAPKLPNPVPIFTLRLGRLVDGDYHGVNVITTTAGQQARQSYSYLQIDPDHLESAIEVLDRALDQATSKQFLRLQRKIKLLQNEVLQQQPHIN